jgi:hypothetical protein
MRRRGDRGIRRWALVGALSIVGVGLVASLFRTPEAGPRLPPPEVPRMLIRADAGIDAAFDEQKILADPTPLYLPTKWNAARKPVAHREPNATFENYYAADIAGSLVEKMKVNLPGVVASAAGPVETFADSPGSVLAGIGQSNLALPVLPKRAAFVEVIAQGTGLPVLSDTLTEASPPGEGGWQPIEFAARIDAMGLVGPLAITHRSGAEGVDEYFQRYLAKTWRVGQRLAPGYYRISVGP